MSDNKKAFLQAALCVAVTILISFALGYLIDGAYLGSVLFFPTLGFISTFKRKAKPCTVKSHYGAIPKTVIGLYFHLTPNDDASKVENDLIKALSTNPQQEVTAAAIIDLPDEPVFETAEDKETLATLAGIYERVYARLPRCVIIVRRREESKTTYELMGKGRKYGALCDLCRIIENEDVSPLAVLGDKKLLNGTEYIFVTNDADELTMDCVKRMTGYSHESAVILPESDEHFRGRGLVSVTRLMNLLKEVPYEQYLFCDRLISSHTKEIISPVKLAQIKPHNPGELLNSWVQRSRKALQELWFIFSRRLDLKQKILIFAELARLLTPLIIFSLMISSYFVYPPAAGWSALVALVMYLASVHRHRIIDELLLIPTQALITVFSVPREIFRLITRKNTLDISPVSHGVLLTGAEIISLCILRSPSGLVRLISLICALMPLRLLKYNLPERKTDVLSYREKKALAEQLTKMWKFFDDNVTREDHYLPPESVQFSPDGICHKTTPGAIGVYLLSCLAAYDKKLLDLRSLNLRLEKSIESIQLLPRFHGRLYESYDTRTLKPENERISDSETGLYIICLICLKEGLSELVKTYLPLEKLIQDIEQLINECDLSKVSNRYLFSQGRLASFLAVAKRDLPKEHWQGLIRQTKSYGFKDGVVSRYGGLDEHFVAELFLKSPKGSLTDQSLEYCLFCHKRKADELNIPYGLCHSGCTSMDESLCYESEHHGISQVAAEEIESEAVCAPYASYLTLQKSLKGSYENLLRFKKLGLWGQYGFFEAIDTKSSEIVKSYRSLHLGLSIIAIVNALDEGIMQKRAAQNPMVGGAFELLSEDMPKDAGMIYDYKTGLKQNLEQFYDISLTEPRVRLFHSQGYTLVLTDCGICSAFYKGEAVYDTCRKLLTESSGMQTDISIKGKAIKPVPDLCEFSDFADYYSNDEELAYGVRIYLHSGFPCEIRSVSLENTSDTEITANVRFTLTSSNINGISMRKDSLVLRSDNMYVQAGFLVENKIRLIPKRTGFEAAAEIKMPPKTKLQISLYLLCGDSLEKLKTQADKFTSEPIKQAQRHKHTGEQRMAEGIISSLIFGQEPSEESSAARSSCTLKREELKEIGLNPKLPIVLVKLNDKNDEQKLSAFLGAFKVLIQYGFEISLVFAFKDSAHREHYRLLIEEIKRQNLEGYFYSQIMPLELSDITNEMKNLIVACAEHIATDRLVEPRKPKDDGHRAPKNAD